MIFFSAGRGRRRLSSVHAAGGGSIHRLCANEAGTSAIEFAILAPIFIFLLMGMIAYGIYFGASHSVAQISADAARVALAGLNETERQALVTDFIERNAGNYVFVDVDHLEVEAHDSNDDGTQYVVAV